MQVTPTDLRRDLYNTLDRVLETGEPVDVVRRGRRLRIIAVDEPAAGSKLARLVDRPEVIRGDPEALVHLDWSDQWRP